MKKMNHFLAIGFIEIAGTKPQKGLRLFSLLNQ